MTSIPLELAQARIARDEAWRLYDVAIDTESNEVTAERFKVCMYLEARCNDLYNEWQRQGGTSDIETLTAVELASKLEIEHQELSSNPDNGEMVQLYPSYHDLIWGAKLTDEHRADIHKTWNERYSK